MREDLSTLFALDDSLASVLIHLACLLYDLAVVPFSLSVLSEVSEVLLRQWTSQILVGFFAELLGGKPCPNLWLCFLSFNTFILL